MGHSLSLHRFLAMALDARSSKMALLSLPICPILCCFNKGDGKLESKVHVATGETTFTSSGATWHSQAITDNDFPLTPRLTLTKLRLFSSKAQ